MSYSGIGSRTINQAISRLRRKQVMNRHYPDFAHEERVQNFSKCMMFVGINAIEGDILEFGVSKGASLIMLDRLVSKLIRDRHHRQCRIFGFDSFDGLPDPKGEDKKHFKFRHGAYKSNRDSVIRRLKESKADIQNISLIQGWYHESLTPELRENLGIERAAFINIDCDLCESTTAALKWCEPLIDQGTIINFDDWFCYQGSPDHGEQLAFQKFLAENPDMTATSFSTCSWHGKSFIINRNRNGGAANEQ